MENPVRRINISLRTLGAVQVVAGFAAALAIVLFAGQEILEIVGKEIMMEGKIIKAVALFCMFLVVSTGIVSLCRVRWGWVFSFSVATVVLVMAFLMGPGTIPITMWSFLGLMILSLVNWTAAIVFYFHDLYT